MLASGIVITIADFQRGLDKIDITGYGGALNKFGDLAGRISQRLEQMPAPCR